MAKSRAISNANLRDGAQGRDRTTDTVIFSHVLYQLSYLGIPARGKSSAYRGGRAYLSSPPSESSASAGF